MAALGSMAASIAHEIRNPLASISGSAQELKSFSEIPETGQSLMDIIVKEVKRLNRIIIQYLEFTKPHPFTPVSVNLKKSLEEAIVLIKKNPSFKKKMHKIAHNNLKTKKKFYGDIDGLKQLFWNILLNGLQAMPEGGTLMITLSEKNNPNRIILNFKDEGVGIPKEIQEEIFQPFKTYRRKGYGLGLSTAYRIVNEHQGKILFKDNKNGGTIFEIQLPYIDYKRKDTGEKGRNEERYQAISG
jgi:signal transduction histidine kinase